MDVILCSVPFIFYSVPDWNAFSCSILQDLSVVTSSACSAGEIT